MNQKTESVRAKQQHKSIRFTIVLLAVVAVTAVAAIILKVSSGQATKKSVLEDYAVIWFDSPRALPEVSLIDHNEQLFTVDQFKGKWNLVNFGYTYCPDICPTNMADMNIAHGLLSETGLVDDIAFWMITVDPSRDTTSQLSLYVPYFNSDFIGLTGEMADIQALATAMSAVFYKEGTGEGYTVAHSDNFAVIDPDGNFVALMRPPHKPQTIVDALTVIMQAP